MNNGLSALPTTYNGVVFRSRTEARWAVLFSALGVVWEHEREGYSVEGRNYLPDFHLPEFPMWFEVKPDETDGAERSHFSALCRLTGKAGIIAYGPPKANRENLLYFSSDGAQRDGNYCWLADRRNEGEYWLYCKDHGCFSIGPVDGLNHGRYPIMTEKLRTAFRSAENEKFGVRGRRMTIDQSQGD